MTDNSSASELEGRLNAARSELKRLEEDIFSIDTQIRKAQADVHTVGRYADAEWWRKVQTAKKYKGKLHQEKQREIGEMSRRLRQLGQLSQEKAFIDSARRLLSPDVFRQIAEDAESALRVARIVNDDTDQEMS